MKVSRLNEPERVWFRSDRVYLSAGEWWFQTREGVDVGPYESQFEAEIEAQLLKELLKESSGSYASQSAIREFVLDSYAMGRPLSPRFRDDEPAPQLVAQGA